MSRKVLKDNVSCLRIIEFFMIFIHGHLGMYLDFKQTLNNRGDLGILDNEIVSNQYIIDLDDSKKELLNQMRIERAKELVELFPYYISMSKEEQENKLREQMLLKEGDSLHMDQCELEPMPQSLEIGLKEYFKLANENNTQCAKETMNKNAGLISRRKESNDKCTMNAKSFKCNVNVRPEELDSEFYPRLFTHYDCAGCKYCMYGSGTCFQESITIEIYHDEMDLGQEKLFDWKRIKKTLGTGCSCKMGKESMVMHLLDVMCRKDEKHRDPTQCLNWVTTG